MLGYDIYEPAEQLFHTTSGSCPSATQKLHHRLPIPSPFLLHIHQYCFPPCRDHPPFNPSQQLSPSTPPPYHLYPPHHLRKHLAPSSGDPEDTFIIVAYRGTSATSFDEWVEDFTFKGEDVGGLIGDWGSAHSGFSRKAFEGLRDGHSSFGKGFPLFLIGEGLTRS